MRGEATKLIRNDSKGELALIERIRRRITPKNAELRLGIGDDCALLRLKSSEEMAVTTDLSIEGRHFRLESHPPQSIGHRALARGLSDIAAMGARPAAAFLSLGLPRDLTVAQGRRPAWVDAFLDGFLGLADKYQTPLAGGDLAESSLAMADIVLLGAVPRGKALLRSGARPGDLLCVTGLLGGAAVGLEHLQKQENSRSTAKRRFDKDEQLAPHLWPQPRIAQGLWLRQKKIATAAIDLSDGLSTDLNHLCQESGVSAEIEAHSLPIHPGATQEQALHGGEDYELLFTVRSKTALPRSIAGIPVTRIGRIVQKQSAGSRVMLLDRSGPRPLRSAGWQHFS